MTLCSFRWFLLLLLFSYIYFVRQWTMWWIAVTFKKNVAVYFSFSSFFCFVFKSMWSIQISSCNQCNRFFFSFSWIRRKKNIPCYLWDFFVEIDCNRCTSYQHLRNVAALLFGQCHKQICSDFICTMNTVNGRVNVNISQYNEHWTERMLMMAWYLHWNQFVRLFFFHIDWNCVIPI